ncbi:MULTISPECIES: TetR/AcrR family transcriptional regulator [Pantoea]|uniref:TetR family transcriptional regulator n=1 Tax=Pantoea brenneri TaxID=472694 RepID=A0ABU9MR47_9GAMM|nr:TetR family transcriptional regulator [Pantoea sp. 3.5.1]KKD30986.1 TetR family transcriptional regulator [Pantoea sp. 3.5.1]
MKVSKQQVQANRAHIVKTASELFRARGFDGIGVAELMSAAGFTHGGFYKHFQSKADLMTEAVAGGFSQAAAQLKGADKEAFIADYLSRRHRDSMATGCMMAALGADTARQPDEVKQAFAAGLENQLAALTTESGQAASDRAELITTIAQMVGAMVLSRACPDDDPLAEEILQVCRVHILNKPAEG